MRGQHLLVICSPAIFCHIGSYYPISLHDVPKLLEDEPNTYHDRSIGTENPTFLTFWIFTLRHLETLMHAAPIDNEGALQHHIVHF